MGSTPSRRILADRTFLARCNDCHRHGYLSSPRSNRYTGRPRHVSPCCHAPVSYVKRKRAQGHGSFDTIESGFHGGSTLAEYHPEMCRNDACIDRQLLGVQPAPDDPMIFNRPGNRRPISEFYEPAGVGYTTDF